MVKTLCRVSAITCCLVFLHAQGHCLDVKEPNVAGQWYPAEKKALSDDIQKYLSQAHPPAVPGEIVALISPHAGYIYSAPVAAYGYKALIGKDIKTAVIVGFNHRFPHEGIAVCDYDAYRTPLGDVPIDRDLSARLIAYNKNIYPLKAAFEGEWSTEAQIPFLQTVFSGLRIVVIHIGEHTYENSALLADALYAALKDKKDYIVIASSDASHYLTYDEANRIDSDTQAELLKMDPKPLYEYLTAGDCRLCGDVGVVAVMLFCQKAGADSVKILKYANSGDTAGQKDRVVGYISAAIYKKNTARLRGSIAYADEVTQDKGGGMLTIQQKKRLLEIARSTIESYLATGSAPEIKESDPLLNRPMGAFVTLNERGDLRGCIGNLVGSQPLCQTVKMMAIEAATGDPRFPRVTTRELKDINIEISVLSELKKVSSPDEIVMGRHGVVVKRGYRSGVFLPQVATETGWGKEEFMSTLCTQKAGLPADAWKDKGTDIFIFEATVFNERDAGVTP